MLMIGALALVAAAVFGWLLYTNREPRVQAAVAPAPITTETLDDNPLAQTGWRVSKILLEQTSGSTIVHAVGKLTNETDRNRFGVKIQLELFDAANQKAGNATDYQASIEPHGQWKFSALVVNSKAVSAKVAAVEESP